MKDKFLRFREIIIDDILNEIKNRGGRMSLDGLSIGLKFYSGCLDCDVFVKVDAVELKAENDDVLIVYNMPEFREENYFFMSEEDSKTQCSTSLHELSTDELYNIICEAKL